MTGQVRAQVGFGRRAAGRRRVPRLKKMFIGLAEDWLQGVGVRERELSRRT